MDGHGNGKRVGMMMRMMARMVLCGAAALCFAGVTHAQEARDLCPDRPGLGTPACTVDKGRVVFELGLADWTREQDGNSRTDTIIAGDALVRVGITDSLEAQLGWTAYGHVRNHDPLLAMTDMVDGVGDVMVAVRQNLHNPDGSGFSIAVMPYATLPSGGAAIGAGDWAAGLIVPVGFDLGHGLSLDLTPQIDAAVDEDRNGRHLAYGSVAGLDLTISDAVSATVEAAFTRDDDPDAHNTQLLAGLSLAWAPTGDRQVDIGLNLGLNHSSPGSELYLGVVQRF